MNLQKRSLFLSITTFLTAFPEKLTKYSGIWELDILNVLWPPYQQNKQERQKKSDQQTMFTRVLVWARQQHLGPRTVCDDDTHLLLFICSVNELAVLTRRHCVCVLLVYDLCIVICFCRETRGSGQKGASQHHSGQSEPTHHREQ